MDIPSIGVAVTTHNRPELRAQCLAKWREFLPAGVPLVLVDDASEVPAEGATFRFERNVGIASAKNKCIELLMDAGIEHLFLSDDDAWPASPDWWKPYVASIIPHLMYLWNCERRYKIWQDRRNWAASHARGGIIYAHRSVIDTVGGMRTDFPRWGDEHVEWSRRIHNAGLTPRPYCDVVNSKYLWHYDRNSPSSVPIAERQATHDMRQALLRKYAASAEWVDYRVPAPAAPSLPAATA